MKRNRFIKLRIEIISIICFFLSSALHAINLDDNRINPFDGIDDYDGVVYLKIGNTICSGVLINYRSILTAAHCYKEGQRVEIYTGKQIQDGDISLEASSFVKLPEGRRYSSFNGASYDLALISLKEPLLNIVPFKLNPELPSLNDQVYISGFGLHGTGTFPDSGFDKRKRWATNKLTIISKEDLVNGISLNNSLDKIILGFYFDKNIDELEGIISLGDSGSPLLAKENNQLSVIGIASWIKKNPETQNRGYGSLAGFSSIQQNLQWINNTNPLRNVSSIYDGEWSTDLNWNSMHFPSNQEPEQSQFNKIPARYYEVNIDHAIQLKKYIQIDKLEISNSGNLSLHQDSNLSVLLDIQIEGGYLQNEGMINSKDLIITNGEFININEVTIHNNLKIQNNILKNDGRITAQKIEIDKGTVKGIGVFISDEFWNKGKISPGQDDNQIGTMTIKSNLINDGIIELDINNKQQSDLLILNQLNSGGSLVINSLSQFYSGNTNYVLFNYDERNNSEFTKIEILGANFGRLTNKLIYGDNAIRFELLNPSYEALGNTYKSKTVGKYIDSFSQNASSNFQLILDQINYVSSDDQIPQHLDDLVLLNFYQPILERLEANQKNYKSGVFISESSFDLNEDNVFYKADSSRIDISYLGLNISHSDIESELIHFKSNSSSESSAYEISYNIPGKYLDFYFGFYDEKKDSKTSRIVNINNQGFSGLHNRSLDINKEFLILEKIFKTNFGNLKAGLAYSFIDVSTDPFTEIFNKMTMSYNLEDINIKLTEPYIEFSKDMQLGNTQASFGLEFRSFNYDSDIYNSEINMDSNVNSFSLEDEINLKDKVASTLYIAGIYKESLYTKLSYFNKDNNEGVFLKIGYLF